MLNIITLMENKPSEHKSLTNKHGLSFLIRYEDRRLLFDCGPDATFLENAHRLGVDVSCPDSVVLSHAHYDHAAGFRDFIEAGNKCGRLYIGNGFFEKKYAVSDGLRYTNLSCGFDETFITEHHVLYTECKETVRISDGITVVSSFPRVYPFETIPERFVRRTKQGNVRDDFHDEVALVLETACGLVVIVGCSHPGILNMVTHIRNIFRQPVYAVFGGTHLNEAEPERIAATIQGLKQTGLKLFGLCHCSGDAAERCIAQDPEINSTHLAAGDEIYLD